MAQSLSAWFAMVFWLGALPWWTGTTAGAAWQAAALAGAVASAFAARPRATAQLPAAAAWAAAPCVAAAFLLPWPFGAAGLLLGPGLLAGRAASPRVRAAGAALALAGSGAAACAALAALLGRYAADLHSAWGVDALVGRALALAGLPGAPLGDAWRVTDIERVTPLALSPESLGLHAVGFLAAALAPFLARRAAPLRAVLELLLLAAGWVLVRQVLLAGLVLSSADPTWSWRADAVALSFLPLAVALGAVARGARGGRPAEPRPLWRPALRPALLATAGTVALWISVADADPGRAGAGRVLVDEHHSAWERTDVPMDTRDYSGLSTYNYAGVHRLLDGWFDMRANLAPLADATLADVDVLVVKTPTEAYAPEEIDAVERFVRRGGGLLLVGDHTNVFGTTTHLAPLAERFGLELATDATYDLPTGGLSLYRAPRALPHGAVAHLPPFLFATSCSLRGAPWARSVQTDGGLLALPADYAKKGYFAEREDGWLFHPFGLFHQTLSVGHGRGRVVAFSDSTVWSNFFAFVPGKPELALGILGWLQRPPLLPLLPVAAFACGAALLFAAGLLALRGGPGGVLPGVLVPALLASAAAVPVLTAWTARANPLPERRRDLPDVVFLGEGCDFFLPATELVSAGPPSYLTFFNWVHRVGLFPSRVERVEEALRDADLLVLLRRTEPLDEAQLAALEGWVRAGGRLLVLGDERGAATAPLLARAGLTWTPRELPVADDAEQDGARSESEAAAIDAAPSDGDAEPPPPPATRRDGSPLAHSAARWARVPLAVAGGERWIASAEGEALVALARLGRGVVAASAAADAFANDALENNYGAPTPEQLELYEVEFALLRELLPELATPAEPPGE